MSRMWNSVTTLNERRHLVGEESGIKLPHLLSIVRKGLLNQFTCVGI